MGWEASVHLCGGSGRGGSSGEEPGPSCVDGEGQPDEEGVGDGAQGGAGGEDRVHVHPQGVQHRRRGMRVRAMGAPLSPPPSTFGWGDPPGGSGGHVPPLQKLSFRNKLMCGNNKTNTAHVSRGGGAESGPPPSLALGYDVRCRRFPEQEVEEGVEVE